MPPLIFATRWNWIDELVARLTDKRTRLLFDRQAGNLISSMLEEGLIPSNPQGLRLAAQAALGAGSLRSLARIVDQGCDVQPCVEGQGEQAALFVEHPLTDLTCTHRLIERTGREIGGQDTDMERRETQLGQLAGCRPQHGPPRHLDNDGPAARTGHRSRRSSAMVRRRPPSPSPDRREYRRRPQRPGTHRLRCCPRSARTTRQPIHAPKPPASIRPLASARPRRESVHDEPTAMLDDHATHGWCVIGTRRTNPHFRALSTGCFEASPWVRSELRVCRPVRGVSARIVADPRPTISWLPGLVYPSLLPRACRRTPFKRAAFARAGAAVCTPRWTWCR